MDRDVNVQKLSRRMILFTAAVSATNGVIHVSDTMLPPPDEENQDE